MRCLTASGGEGDDVVAAVTFCEMTMTLPAQRSSREDRFGNGVPT
jgi:hypothetical protein